MPFRFMGMDIDIDTYTDTRRELLYQQWANDPMRHNEHASSRITLTTYDLYQDAFDRWNDDGGCCCQW